MYVFVNPVTYLRFLALWEANFAQLVCVIVSVTTYGGDN